MRWPGAAAIKENAAIKLFLDLQTAIKWDELLGKDGVDEHPLDLGQLGRRLGRDGAAVLRRPYFAAAVTSLILLILEAICSMPASSFPRSSSHLIVVCRSKKSLIAAFSLMAAAPGHRIQPHGDSSDEEEGSKAATT